MAWAIELQPDDLSVNPIAELVYLEDPTGRMTLQEVQGLREQFRPWAGGGEHVSLGFTESAYWIRLPLKRASDAPSQWLVELHYGRFNQLEFHVPDQPPVITGSQLPFNSRPFFHRFFVFPVEVGTAPMEVYFRVTSQYSLTMPVTVWAPDAFRKKEQKHQLAQFMYSGVVAVLALYGLLIFVALKDQRFLIYACYSAVLGLGMFASNGYGYQFLWPQWPAFEELSQNFLFNLLGFNGVWLVKHFLLVRAEQPRLNILMNLSAGLFLLCAAATLSQLFWSLPMLWLNQVLLMNGLALAMLVCIASLKAYTRRQPGVRLFAAGWLALSLGIVVATLRVYNLIPSNGFTLYAVQIGTTIEVLLMAMALSELLRHEHHLHITIKDQAMQSQVALLEVTRSSEEKLKQAVEERTLQLAISLQQEKQLREQYVRFGSMISHEFRTPLAIIQSQLSVMRKEYQRGIDQVEPRLDAIGSATNRLSDMFEKWLHSDALSQTLDVMELKPLDLQPWLQSQLNESRHLLVHQTLSFEQQTESCLVRADAYHLSIVLNNLLDNAAKYSPAGSTITVGLHVLNNHIGLFVSDQGVGIPSPMLEKIFNEFFRVSPESSVRGAGLGLSIVKRIVQAHGGEVQVRSLPIKGTVFTVWLPMLQRDKHE